MSNVLLVEPDYNRQSEKPELIRAIQKAEGTFDCFGSAASGYCDQFNYL